MNSLEYYYLLLENTEQGDSGTYLEVTHFLYYKSILRNNLRRILKKRRNQEIEKK